MIHIAPGSVYVFDDEIPDGWDEPAPVEVTDVDDHSFDPDLRTVHVRHLDSEGERYSHYADEFLNMYRKVADSVAEFEA